MNAREAVPLRQGLIEMGHPQPATPMKTDNSTATGIINKTIKQKRSKAIDMRFYWLCDRVQQGMFDVYWAPGLSNLADYPTKHHSGKHHKAVRPIYLSLKDSPRTMKGCIELLNYKKQSESKIEPVTEKQSSLSAIVKRTKRTKRISLKPKENRFLSHKLRVPGTQSKTKTQSKRQSRLLNRSSYNCGQLYLNPINQLLKQ